MFNIKGLMMIQKRIPCFPQVLLWIEIREKKPEMQKKFSMDGRDLQDLWLGQRPLLRLKRSR